MKFSNTLCSLVLQNKRDLPWRGTTNPYAFIEIISFTTAAHNALFFSLSAAFPTVFDLAEAN
jgi:A/G-specific adenine glycosylase